jgi:poly-gamma-glutamate synthase PgsB/CapB
MLILPDGSEREIARPGSASIREQVRLVALAAELGADTIVAEMMSIGPEYLAVESGRILRPATLAVTNVRLDHLDEMGRTRDAVARTLAAAFPGRAAVLFPEEELQPAFEKAAARTGSMLRPVGRPADGQGESEATRLPLGQFEPNVRLARAVLASLGVEEATARRGMAEAPPDFGSLRVWRGRFGGPARPAVCVSAFAANEPESTSAVLARVTARIPLEGRPLVGLFCLREDRGDAQGPVEVEGEVAGHNEAARRDVRDLGPEEGQDKADEQGFKDHRRFLCRTSTGRSAPPSRRYCRVRRRRARQARRRRHGP